MNITVLGSGGWGTALAVILDAGGHRVTLWSHSAATAEALLSKGENTKYLPGVPLSAGIAVTTAQDCTAGADMIILSAPSFAFEETLGLHLPCFPSSAIIVNTAKGLGSGNRRLSEVFADRDCGRHAFVVLSGPSHAEETARGIPTAIVAASSVMDAAEIVQDTFMGPNLRVYTCGDVTGVELGGALKNVIALAAGISDGLGCGDNTKAALMTRGITEISRLSAALGGRPETLSGLSGFGDLIVTCTSAHSRNRRAGIMIGQGIPVEQAIERAGGVVEGYYAADATYRLSCLHHVEMPITSEICQTLYHGKSPRDVLTTLMSREPRRESEQLWLGTSL